VEELERIRDAATISIGRASGFAVIANLTFVFGLIAWPVLAMRAGGHSFALTAAILILKAFEAARRDFRRSETWLILDRRHHLPPARAQSIVSGILVDTFLRYATYAGLAAAAFWLTALGLWLAGAKA
jgi:hypothetical protein